VPQKYRNTGLAALRGSSTYSLTLRTGYKKKKNINYEAAPTETFMRKNEGQYTSGIARLRGIRFVTTTEAEQGRGLPENSTGSFRERE
jgi:hypothetical protein